MITNTLKGIELPVYSDGKNIRDWLHVEDHCSALLSVLEKGVSGESYHIGGICEKRNKKVVNLICDYLDEKLGPIRRVPRKGSIRYVPDRPGHDRRYALDISKIKKKLGWEPEVSFEEGMQLTIDWYLQNLQWVEKILDGTAKDYY